MPKRAFDTGGMSLARGARNFARDALRNDGMPSMTVPGAFEVGSAFTWLRPDDLVFN